MGPIDAAELSQLLLDGVVANDTPIWSKGLGDWQELRDSELVTWMAQRSTPSAAAAPWFYLDDEGSRLGPVHTEEMRALYADAKIELDSAVWSKAQQQQPQQQQPAAFPPAPHPPSVPRMKS